MDQKECHAQSLGICNKLYNFIMKNIATHAFKIVTLGVPPVHRDESKVQNRAALKNDQLVHPMAEEEISYNLKNSDSSSIDGPWSNTHGNDGREPLTVEDNSANLKERPEEDATQPKPLKKVVSINDRVEQIEIRKRKTKRKKSTEKLPWLEPEEDDPKPLKSILKVGSDIGERSNSFGS